MADEFHSSGSWWDSSRTSQSSSTGTTMGSFGWPADISEVKTRSPLDSEPVSGSSAVFHDTRNLQGQDSGGAGNLHMMGLGLSSQTVDWNQALLRGEKTAESSFGLILQENMNTKANFQQESGKFNPGLPSSFEMDSAVYGSPSSVFQGQRSSYENRSVNCSYPGGSYSLNSNELLPSWSSSGALPQFLRNSPPKQVTQSHLQFSNNAPFWNASAAAMNDARPSFFPATLQPQFPTPILDSRKTKITQEIEDSSSAMKKSGSDQSASKKARSETPSTLPAFKVRKKKMGDRITALQQLVSPFGKTDTASVLSEAIEYIKFLHEQVTALSTPYLKSGAPMQHQQNFNKSKETEGAMQDLKSRGLCLVPISSTFPVTHETTVDFWTHTFGGTFR